MAMPAMVTKRTLNKRPPISSFRKPLASQKNGINDHIIALRKVLSGGDVDDSQIIIELGPSTMAACLASSLADQFVDTHPDILAAIESGNAKRVAELLNNHK